MTLTLNGLLDSLATNRDNTQFQQAGLLGTGEATRAADGAHCTEDCARNLFELLD